MEKKMENEMETLDPCTPDLVSDHEAKTQFSYTILSKRKLAWFVDNGYATALGCFAQGFLHKA